MNIVLHRSADTWSRARAESSAQSCRLQCLQWRLQAPSLHKVINPSHGLGDVSSNTSSLLSLCVQPGAWCLVPGAINQNSQSCHFSFILPQHQTVWRVHSLKITKYCRSSLPAVLPTSLNYSTKTIWSDTNLYNWFIKSHCTSVLEDKRVS